mmetsp:Transcript_48764/g.93280  ORF Transcript_48764/g.93280 Transcript_48764/m.93280 type:complete len:120 (-) Transcript_48764:266-625(-)
MLGFDQITGLSIQLARSKQTSAFTAFSPCTRSLFAFGMLADPAAALAVVFGPAGALEGMGQGKAYVDMSTVDAATSAKISEGITGKGARFLEAPVSGSKKPAIDGELRELVHIVRGRDL